VGTLGGWLQIVSNVGIVVGLALVALQMKQASDIASAQLSSDYFLNVADTYGSAAGDDVPAAWARAQANPPDLTDAEVSAVRYWLTRQWMLSVRLASLEESGFAPPPDSEAFVTGWINLLGNEVSQRWWVAEHDRILLWVPDLRDAVDERLREVGAAQRTVHRRLLEQMRTGPLPGEGSPPASSAGPARDPSVATTRPAQ
jgi:hypothetical protein